MRNVLVVVTSVVIAVLALAFVGPRFIDWNGYRGTIEEEATRLLGRDVRVGGQVSVQLLPSPTFLVEGVRIADAEANAGAPFFAADAITGTLALTPLLRGRLQAQELILQRPQIHVVLDADGGGNWTSLGRGARLPFLADDVTLDAVRIERGQLTVYGPDRAERIHVEAIDGELSMAAIDGPYRFRGYFGTAPARRELRVGTTRREPDGSLRFKASVKHLDTNAVFNFDARAVDIARAPRVEGELSAQIPLPRLGGAATPAAGDVEAPVEIKAALAAGARAVRLGNLTLAFERQGRPQILKGEAQVSLVAPVATDVTLSATWLDLDQLIGTPAQAAANPGAFGDGPLAGLLQLATRLNGFNPESGTARLALDVEQAMLGREPVSGIKLRLQGRGAETQIEEFRIGLPGSARADIKGLMSGSGEETNFDGSLLVRGGSLARLLAWGTGGNLILDPARDGPFATRARLVAAPQSLQARDFVGDLAGTNVQGAIGYAWRGRREISVLVEGPQVDLRPFLPARPQGTGAGSIFGALREAAHLGPTGTDVDAIIRLRTGQLVVPGATFQDASADLQLRDGRIRVEHLRLTAGPGTTVELEGDGPVTAGGAAGRLRGHVTAQDRGGLAVLADLLGVPPEAMPAPEVLATLAPLRLAGDVTFSDTAGAALEMRGDGDVAGSRVRLSTRLSRGLTTWRTAPLEVSATIAGPRADALIAALTGSTAPRPKAERSLPQLNVDAIGTLREGLTGRLAFASSGGIIGFRGTFGLDGDAPLTAATLPVRFAGEVRLEAADGADLLGRLWPTWPLGPLSGRTVAGSFGLERAGGDTSLSRIALRAGDANVRGGLTFSVPVGGRPQVRGDLHFTLLSASDLLRLFQASPAAGPVAAAQAVLSNRSGPWSPDPFAAAAPAADGVLATVTMTADRLVVAGPAALLDTRLTLAVEPGRVELRDIAGQAARGTWTGALKLDRTQTPAAATLLVRLTDIEAAEVGLGDRARGTFGGTLTLTGRGASPHEIMTSLVGRGTLSSGETRIDAMQPASIAAALAQAVRGPADTTPARLKAALADGGPVQPPLVVPPRAVPVEIARGVLTARPVTADSADGQMTAQLMLDLATLRLTGDWSVAATLDALPPPPSWTPSVAPVAEAAPKGPRPPLLPPVVTSFAAALGGAGPPTVTRATEALERDIAVRRLERDIDDLERLRRQDEERATAEAERRRLQEGAGLAPPPIEPVPNAAVLPAVPGAPPPAPGPAPAAPPKAATPQPAPAYRPLSKEEQRRIFGGG